MNETHTLQRHPKMRLTPLTDVQLKALQVAAHEGGLRYGGIWTTTIRKDVPIRLTRMGLMRRLDQPSALGIRSEWVLTESGRALMLAREAHRSGA